MTGAPPRRGAPATGAAHAVARLAGTLLAAIFLPLALAAPGEEAGAADPVAVQSSADAVQGQLPAEILILFGCVFVLAAALGMLRFPDFYTRLHAATKLVTLGGLGVFGGAALALTDGQATGRVLLIAVFFFLTAPLSGYMIARAAYLRGMHPYWEPSSVDEWGACGEAAGDPDEDEEFGTRGAAGGTS